MCRPLAWVLTLASKPGKGNGKPVGNDDNGYDNLKKRLSSLSIMLCAPVFIFTSGSSALLGRPRCGLSI